MATIGELLKNRRLELGYSIKEVSDSTKISSNFLTAIENNDFKKLPRGVFPKMFIKSYAKFLGLDVDEAVHLFYEQIAVTDIGTSSFVQKEDSKPKKNSILSFVIAAIVIIIIIAIASMSGLFKTDATQCNSKPNLKRASKPSLAPPKKTNLGQSNEYQEISKKENTIKPESKIIKNEQNKKPNITEHVLDISISATDLCWVKINGKNVENKDFILKAGENVKFKYNTRINIIIGNAGGVKLYFNNRAVPLPHEKGKVVSFVVSPDNYADFTKPVEVR